MWKLGGQKARKESEDRKESWKGAEVGRDRDACQLSMCRVSRWRYSLEFRGKRYTFGSQCIHMAFK